jgi:hypothetical protein
MQIELPIASLGRVGSLKIPATEVAGATPDRAVRSEVRGLA